MCRTECGLNCFPSKSDVPTQSNGSKSARDQVCSAQPRPATPASYSHPRSTSSPLVNAQQLSPLFAKLPAELRLAVYELVLPRYRTCQIRFEYQRLYRLPASSDVGEIEHEHAQYWHRGAVLSGSQNYRRMKRDAPVVFLLCKRTYGEALDLLMSTETFVVASPVDLIHFHRFTPSSSFARITSLVVLFCTTYISPKIELNARNWETALQILSGLLNLRCLTIALVEICWKQRFPASVVYKQEPALRISPEWWWGDGPLNDGEFSVETAKAYLGWVDRVKVRGEVVALMFGERCGGRNRCLLGRVEKCVLKGS